MVCVGSIIRFGIGVSVGKLKWLFTEGVTDLTSYRLGQVQERERIIKLLEESAEVTDYVEIKLDKLIALIKGEK